MRLMDDPSTRAEGRAGERAAPRSSQAANVSYESFDSYIYLCMYVCMYIFICIIQGERVPRPIPLFFSFQGAAPPGLPARADGRAGKPFPDAFLLFFKF